MKRRIPTYDEYVVNEFSMYADIKSFRMKFDKPCGEDLFFKEVIKILESHGLSMGLYNSLDKYLISIGPIFDTCDETVFDTYANIPILTYKEFTKKI